MAGPGLRPWVGFTFRVPLWAWQARPGSSVFVRCLDVGDEAVVGLTVLDG